MNFWTDEKKQTAARLWKDGRSAGEIAAELGCGRSAVIGIAHRNRDLFPNRRKIEKQVRLPKREPMARRIIVRKAQLGGQCGPAPSIGVDLGPSHLKSISSICPAAPVGWKPVTILELTNTTCRWPLWPMGDNPGAAGLYCGEETAKDSAWCRHHRMRARAAA